VTAARPEATMRDAIVVGAGLSGLVCARRLAGAGRDVIVLEAQDRIGGRLLTGRVGGAVVDLGGQWMSPGQPRLAALAAELGVASAPHRRAGRLAVAEPEAGFFAQLAAAFAQWRAVRRIERRFRSLPPAAGAEAAALDGATAAAWLARAIPNPLARARIAMHAELVFAADPAELSALYYLATLGVTGGFRPEGPELPGGGEHRFTGGAATLAARLAGVLDVRLGEPVRAICGGPADASLAVVTVRATYAARRVVLAVPPALARRIDVELAPAARALAEASRVGPVVKCFAAYDRAFWRDTGWSGEAYRLRGAVRATVALDPDPVLCAFVVGPAAADWAHRAPDDRRGEVMAALAEHFGAPAAAPAAYLEHDWAADPWAAGCVAGLPPGALSAGAAWRAPHGRLHLAGTESAERWPGYMEGAIEAGERAAAEIAAALRGG
jgi:monoamine oxidase